MDYHFAQFNVAWLRKPLDHPDIADFKNAIDPLHDLANQAPGFVWRLMPEGHRDAATGGQRGDVVGSGRPHPHAG
jgi:hypothetical protein